MRSFPFPDRYRIGPGIFGMRSVSPVPSCSCSVACLVRSFCGSGGDEVASACADSSRLGMFSGYRLYTFLYRPSSSRCFGFPVSSFLRLCGLGQRPDRMRGLWLPTVAGRCKSSGCECAWHMEDNRFFTFGKSSLMLGPRAPHCFSTRPEKSAGRSGRFVHIRRRCGRDALTCRPEPVPLRIPDAVFYVRLHKRRLFGAIMNYLCLPTNTICL